MSDHLETNTRVFIFRVWLEEDDVGKRKAKWRGTIVNVSPDVKNKKEHYVSDLLEVNLYILSHLIRIGVSVNWFWRTITWLKRITPK